MTTRHILLLLLASGLEDTGAKCYQEAAKALREILAWYNGTRAQLRWLDAHCMGLLRKIALHVVTLVLEHFSLIWVQGHRYSWYI